MIRKQAEDIVIAHRLLGSHSLVSSLDSRGQSCTQRPFYGPVRVGRDEIEELRAGPGRLAARLATRNSGSRSCNSSIFKSRRRVGALLDFQRGCRNSRWLVMREAGPKLAGKVCKRGDGGLLPPIIIRDHLYIADRKLSSPRPQKSPITSPVGMPPVSANLEVADPTGYHLVSGAFLANTVETRSFEGHVVRKAVPRENFRTLWLSYSFVSRYNHRCEDVNFP